MTSHPRQHQIPVVDGDEIATAFNGPTDEVPEPYVREVPPDGIDGDEPDASSGTDDGDSGGETKYPDPPARP